MKNNILLLLRSHWLTFALFLLSIVFFIMFPETDLIVARYFYNDGNFYSDPYDIAKVVYLVFAKIHFLYLVLIVAGIGFCAFFRHSKALGSLLFLLIVLLFGPGLLVNFVLKNHSVGRPRPVHIIEFGGKEAFSPAFHYSGVCKKNCSFVSGHAAIGFYTMALAWVFASRNMFLLGLAIGLGCGYVRILQGGHFLSDVIFAGWSVYFICALSAIILSRKWPHLLPNSINLERLP